jgi:DNA-binding MarR family transcriptional regulator
VSAGSDDRGLVAAGLLLEAQGRLTAALERRLAADCDGLSVQAYAVLLCLARSADRRLRMTELATRVALSPSGLTRAVDRLEEEGLVERERCPSDRRGAFTVLTDAGAARVDAALPVHLALLDECVTSVLDTDELTRLVRALRKVRDRADSACATPVHGA